MLANAGENQVVAVGRPGVERGKPQILAPQHGNGVELDELGFVERGDPEIEILTGALAPENDVSAVRGPNRLGGGFQGALDRARHSAVGGDDEHVALFEGAGGGGVEGDQAAVGGKAGAAAVAGDQAGVAAEHGDHMEPAAVGFGAEDDSAAVGREDGLVLVGLAAGEADHAAERGLLQPDVEVALAGAVGGVGDQRAVGRQRRRGSES